ncbi:MAG: hypothetical protein AUJ48_00710 [Deltaproteobacteria bacterium CG1_02_45_11]|nr:MAG: hypothetical protein AUJ48_00710 [Deltaproteobacteria bacterium CG1_02_45_11]
MYQIDDLEHRYSHGHPALTVDTLSIKPASIIGLIGHNGSGKSTLLKLLAFVEKPTRGKILFKGKAAESFSDSVRFQVTLLPQETYLMKRSVFDNVVYGLKIRGGKNDYQERVYQALASVGLPAGEFARRQWHQLSGGEAQRVAMAARLVLKPEALLLDEPTASVDADSAQLIKDASVRARHEWGTTLVIANQDWQWLYEICDEILHLFKGRVLGTGMENIIIGPWQRRSDGTWEKILPGGQHIVVPEPPRAQAVAIIEPISISVSLQGYSNNSSKNVLAGIISRLVLDKNTQNIVVSIIIGNISFTAKMIKNKVSDLSLYPGREVFITYDINSVKWL